MRFKEDDQPTMSLLLMPLLPSLTFFIPFHFVYTHEHFSTFFLVFLSSLLVLLTILATWKIANIPDEAPACSGANSDGFAEDSDGVDCGPEVTICSLSIVLITTVILFFCFVFLI